jgi:Nucleotidyl transferase AbiEii toxin, Type IV TA system
MNLYYNTISEKMKEVLLQLMHIPELSNFRLVGGTSLSLQLGHRKSVDIDLFTDRNADFNAISEAIKSNFKDILLIHNLANGQTWSLDSVKVDIYDWKVPFLHSPLEYDGIRLAGLEDIAAYKFESISNRRSEKDFRDLAEILKYLSFNQILTAFRQRYSFVQTSAIIPILLDSNSIIVDETIEMINGESFETASIRISSAIKDYENEFSQRVNREKEERNARLEEILKRKKKE